MPWDLQDNSPDFDTPVAVPLIQKGLMLGMLFVLVGEAACKPVAVVDTVGTLGGLPYGTLVEMVDGEILVVHVADRLVAPAVAVAVAGTVAVAVATSKHSAMVVHLLEPEFRYGQFSGW